MTQEPAGAHDREVDERHLSDRAQLLPEERAAGSADPAAQAAAILAESRERTESPESADPDVTRPDVDAPGVGRPDLLSPDEAGPAEDAEGRDGTPTRGS
jgi:hypothetical protein